jgi:hypothetical protein
VGGGERRSDVGEYVSCGGDVRGDVRLCFVRCSPRRHFL